MNDHNDAPFPAHIYSPERRTLATQLVQKELRKLYPDLKAGAWKSIDMAVNGWAENPATYHLEEPYRDFWDICAAVIESIKLKPTFIEWITAENVSWTKRTMKLTNLQMTSPLDQLENVPGLKLRNDIPLTELIEALKRSPDALKQQKSLVEQHTTDPLQNDYPIIIRRAEGGLYKVMDGNRRMLWAVTHRQTELEAWVGEIDGNIPRNYWVPLNDMFQFAKVFKQAREHDDHETQTAAARILKAHFEASTVARIAYQTRIGNQSDIARQLYDKACEL
jgi:hypothetical protein